MGKNYMHSEVDDVALITTQYAQGLRFDEKRAKPLFENPLPVDAWGNPELPPNSVVAIVNHDCAHCHAFLIGTNYPVKTPDGRDIVYVDMATQKGQDYFTALGLTGDTGKDVWQTLTSSALGLNGNGVAMPDGSPMPSARFPILLDVNSNGKLDYALTVGPANAIEMFNDLQRAALHRAAEKAGVKPLAFQSGGGSIPHKTVDQASLGASRV